MISFDQLSTIQLLHPERLWLLLLVLFLWLTSLRKPHVKTFGIPGLGIITSVCYRFHYAQLINAFSQKQDGKINLATWKIVFFTCLVLALSQPVYIQSELPVLPEKKNIIFVVDTSVNMTIKDYQVEGKNISRLAVLKGVLSQFAVRLASDQMSVILYADKAYKYIPLTNDKNLLVSLINRIQTGLAGRSNGIGYGLALAVDDIRTNQNSKSVVILFTDGERITGELDPYYGAKQIGLSNAKLYTVAIGSNADAANEIKYSGLIYNPIDANNLSKMAELSGGRMFSAADASGLSAAIDEIDAAEAEYQKKTPRFIYIQLYRWFLVLAVALFTFIQLNSLRNGLF